MRRLGVALAGLVCLSSVACYAPPPVTLPAPARATLLGTLSPPPDEPGFDVAGQVVSIQGAGASALDAQTDRLGHFEARLAATGPYTIVFSTETHSATAEVAVDQLDGAVRVELVAHHR